MRGLGAGLFSQVILAFIGLWVARFLLQRLGQSQYGLWLVGMQLLAYLALTDLGVVALLPREVAYATGRGQNKGDDLQNIVAETARIILWQLPIVVLVAAAFWIFLPSSWEPLRMPLGIVLISFVVTFPLRAPAAILSGLQDLAFVSILQSAATFAGTAATVILVARGRGLESLAIGWATTQVMVGVVAIVRLAMRFPHSLPRSLPHLTGQVLRHRMGQAFWVALSQVAVVLLNATDAVIIAQVLGPAAVVPYVCTAKLIQFLGNQPQLLMQTAQPGLAELRASEHQPRVFQAATALTQAVLMLIGAIACGVLAVNYGFVRLWVGEAQWGGFILTGLLIVRVMLAQWNLTTATAIFAFGYERRLALVGIADGILFVGITTALVRHLGIRGAPLAGILALGVVSLPINLSALARESGSTVFGLVRELWPWAWRFAISLAVAGAIATVWRPASFLALATAGTMAVAVYGVLTVRRLLHPPLSLYLHPKLGALLRRLTPATRSATLA